MGRTARGPWRRWLVRALVALLVLLALPLLPVLWHRSVDPDFTAFMRQARGELEAQGRSGTIVHRWVPLAAIDPDLRRAVLAAEDQRFLSHHGFDFEAIAAAYAHNRHARRVRGASTISQQVAKNLYLWPGRSWLRKGLEAYLTVLIEATWSKRRILEVYLNVAQFDADLFGAEAAAQRFFHGPAARLTREQAALLAAALPDPLHRHVAAPSRYLQRRQRLILEQMDELGPEELGELLR